MAASDWVEIYATYTGEELSAEIEQLKKLATPLSSQQIGSKSYTKDLREVRDRLQAANRVLRTRNASAEDYTAIADFSRVTF
jgi:small-conductance mechanosensitive channel